MKWVCSVCGYVYEGEHPPEKCPVCKALKLVTTILGIATGTLFVVYFLNLDQKLLAWAYARVNEIFDRKPVDIKF